MISVHGQKSAWASILPVAMLAAPTGGDWLRNEIESSGMCASSSALISMPQDAEPTGVETEWPLSWSNE